MKNFTNGTLDKLLQAAKLTITKEERAIILYELELFEKQLKLQTQFDLTEVEPAFFPFKVSTTHLRDDKITSDKQLSSDILKQSSNFIDNYFITK